MMENQDIFEAKREQQDTPSAKHGMRALFSTQLGTNVESLYKNAVSNGAKVIAGKPGFEGELVQPCVLGSVNDSMDIFHKETFGPILSVIGFDTIEEAIEQANRTEYGLAAGVFGKDIERAFQVAMQLEAGQVHVNGQSVHDHGLMPHGGWKSSGYGRFNGIHGVQEFTQLKGITVQK
jgi:acyl-CoA reductase-like NAD-dependent aldehyde dehydrogenase